MASRFRYTRPALLLALIVLLAFSGPITNGMFVAHAYDRPHDSGHELSDQEDTDKDNPDDDDNKDKDEDPVELLSGNLQYDHEDLAFLSAQSRLELVRFYNSQERYNGPLGYGWNFNFNMKAIPVALEGQEYVFVRDFNGIRLKFKKRSDGSYEPPPGWYHTLRVADEGNFELVKCSGQIFAFDSDGDLVQIRSCCNPDRIELIYDAKKRLEAIRGSRGGAFFFTYTDRNKIYSVEDQAGRKIYYAYNEEQELIEFRGAGEQQILRYAYDDNHNLSGVTNGLGEILLQNRYDEQDRVIEQTNRGGTFTFAYDTANRKVTITDQDGKYRIHKMNEFGQPLEITDENGKTEYFTWNAAHRLSEYTNKLGETLRFEYDAAGNRIKTIFGDGREIGVSYTGSNKIESLTDPLGNVTRYEYSPQGYPTRKVYPSGQRFSGASYDSEGRVTGVFNGLSSAADPTYRLEYDSDGRVSKVMYPNGQVEQFEYNLLGYQSKWITRSGAEIFYGYNDAGLVNRVSYKTGNTYAVYNYRYDPDGNLVELTDPVGAATRFSVDQYGRVLEKTGPLGNSTRFEYSRGNLTRRTDANGQITNYSYDPTGRLTGIAYPDGTGITYTYNALGRLTSADDGTVSVSFDYNIMGKVIRIDCPFLQKSITYTYDDAGRLTNVATVDHSANDAILNFGYELDADGLVTAMNFPGSLAAGIQYDAAGRLQTISYPNGVQAGRIYNDFGLVEQLSYRKDEADLEKFAYQFDLNGNVTRRDRNGQTTTYTYDDMNRLTGAVIPGVGTFDYKYDLRDNRISRSLNGFTATYNYDKAGRLLTAGNASYSWDGNGNLVKKDNGGEVTLYRYDYENRLTGITLPDGTEITYRYYPLMPSGAGPLAAFGEQMISKAVNGIDQGRYLVGLDMDPLLFLAADNTIQRWNGGGPGMDDVLASFDGTSMEYFLRDTVSSVIARTAADATVSDTYDYLPFGAAGLDGTGNPFGFTGRLHQPESGLIYYRARFYDSDTGRFLSRDSIKFAPYLPREHHLYGYVLNNPVNFSDPSGHEKRCPGSAWTGAVAGGEAHFGLGLGINEIAVCCTARPSLCCVFLSLSVSAGLEASASAGGQVIQFFNCPDADAIAGWGGGVSGEIAVGGGVDGGASVGTSGCAAISGGGGVGVGGGVSVDFGYTWNKGCTK